MTFLDLVPASIHTIALHVVGLLLLRELLPRAGRIERLALAFPIGGGLFTWVLFLFGWAGVPLGRLTLGAAYLTLVISALAIRWRRTPSYGARSNEHPQGGRRAQVVFWGIWGLLAIAFGALAVGRAYSTWDAIAIWSIKGYGMAQEASLFAGEAWGSHRLSYPLNLPLLIGSYFALDGDPAPGSKLIFSSFFLSLVLFAYVYWRRRKVPFGTGLLGVLFLGSLPIIFDHATSGYANLPFSFYLTAGLLYWIQSLGGRDRGPMLVSGLLLGLSIWTRPEGLYMVGLTAMILAAGSRLHGRADLGWRVWLAPLVLIGGSWGVFATLYGRGGPLSSAPAAAIREILNAQFHVESVYLIFRFLGRTFLDLDTWGLLVPAVVLSILVGGRWRRLGRERTLQLELLAVASMGVILAGIYYLISFVGNLEYYLSTGVDRLFLPVGVLAVLWSVHLTFGRPSKPQQQGKEVEPG